MAFVRLHLFAWHFYGILFEMCSSSRDDHRTIHGDNQQIVYCAKALNLAATLFYFKVDQHPVVIAWTLDLMMRKHKRLMTRCGGYTWIRVVFNWRKKRRQQQRVSIKSRLLSDWHIGTNRIAYIESDFGLLTSSIGLIARSTSSVPRTHYCFNRKMIVAFTRIISFSHCHREQCKVVIMNNICW